MPSWTVSVNFHENGPQVQYSVRMWRVQPHGRTSKYPQLHWDGSLPTPLTDQPSDWLRDVAVELVEQL